MNSDYQFAEAHFLDPQHFGFINQNAHLAIVVHETAGDATPEAVQQTFLATGKSVHYAIGQDGMIWQFIPEKDGAGGNCCADESHEPYWNAMIAKYGNLNLCTISIEHCTPDTTSQEPLPQVQLLASYRLINHLLQKYHLGINDVKPHSSIDATTCPGSYDFAGLHQYVANVSQPNITTVTVQESVIETIKSKLLSLASEIGKLP